MDYPGRLPAPLAGHGSRPGLRAYEAMLEAVDQGKLAPWGVSNLPSATWRAGDGLWRVAGDESGRSCTPGIPSGRSTSLLAVGASRSPCGARSSGAY